MKSNKGFTLIEIIITLTMVAIVAAMVVPYLSTSLSQSGTPMWRLRDALALKQVMENITQDYHSPGMTLTALVNKIGPENTSQNNNYGSYQVIKNRFIEFPGNTEVPGGTNLLKVTISDSKGEQLTTLFYRKE